MIKSGKNILHLLNKSNAHLLNNKLNLLTTQRCLSNGINFSLSDEQIEFRDAARKFVDEVIIPNAAEWDQKNVRYYIKKTD